MFFNALENIVAIQCLLFCKKSSLSSLLHMSLCLLLFFLRIKEKNNNKTRVKEEYLINIGKYIVMCFFIRKQKIILFSSFKEND
jgi:hypothetical protein